MKTSKPSYIILSVIVSILIITGCQDSRFESEYFEFAKESDAIEFKSEIRQVPDHVDDDMVYFCRNGVYDKRQVVYKGVNGKALIRGAYRTTDARIRWNKDIPDNKYIAEIIVPKPDETLLYYEFQKAVNQQFGIETERKAQPVDVLELNKIDGESINIEKTDASEVRWSQEDGMISGVGINMGMLSKIIERVSNEKPVFNKIHESQRYAIDIKWEPGNINDLNSKLSQFGLELVPKQKEVEVLVVNSAVEET